MSRLEFLSRPLVAFDPALKEHRRIYYNFVVQRSWKSSPYRFICPEDHGTDLVTMMQRMMIEYYIQREFKDVVKEQQPKIRPKGKRNG